MEWIFLFVFLHLVVVISTSRGADVRLYLRFLVLMRLLVVQIR